LYELDRLTQQACLASGKATASAPKVHHLEQQSQAATLRKSFDKPINYGNKALKHWWDVKQQQLEEPKEQR
jgi:hypothetical protein